MKPQQRLEVTRWIDLAAIVGVAGVISFGLFYFSYRMLPPLPTLAGVVPALVGCGLAMIGLAVRRRIRAQGEQRPAPLPPLLGGRIVMVAKASALAGAALVGLWLGALAYLLPRSVLAAAVADRTSAVVGLAGAVMLTAGALVLERCCRRPPSSEGSDERE